jgi:hypothetical protein
MIRSKHGNHLKQLAKLHEIKTVVLPAIYYIVTIESRKDKHAYPALDRKGKGRKTSP